jgi:heme-degrading monooxygenase HmoA
MFVRMVTLTCKSGQSKKVCQTLNDEALPILTKQRGFQDATVLVSTTTPNRVIAQTFWNTREDAERYHRDHFEKIKDTMKEMFSANPIIETYEVNASTTHRISAGKAA